MRCCVLILALLGCSTPPAAEPRDGLDPRKSGASVYIIEASDDWLDDGMDILSRSPDAGTAFCVGEQALQIILRVAARGRAARLVRVEDFEPQAGVLTPLSFPEPVSYMVPSPDGKYELRRHPETAGYEFSMLPLLSSDSKYATVMYSLRRRCANLSKIPGTDLAAGAPAFEEVWLHSGRTAIPIGGALLWNCPKGEGRSDVIILHLASVPPFRN
jgi:hypothetical protein